MLITKIGKVLRIWGLMKGGTLVCSQSHKFTSNDGGECTVVTRGSVGAP